MIYPFVRERERERQLDSKVMCKKSAALKYHITYAKNQFLYLIIPIENGIQENKPKKKKSYQLMVKN